MKKRVLSKTKIKTRLRRKTSPALAEAINLSLRNPSWMKYSKILSGSARRHSSVNLKNIDAQTSMGDTILIPGRVLSIGEITKKIRICSFGISRDAMEKLSKTRSEWVSITEEIKKNPKAEGLKLIR